MGLDSRQNRTGVQSYPSARSKNFPYERSGQSSNSPPRQGRRQTYRPVWQRGDQNRTRDGKRVGFGEQTCALPISARSKNFPYERSGQSSNSPPRQGRRQTYRPVWQRGDQNRTSAALS